MTPRYFSLLLKRYEYNRERQEFMVAQLTSWVANTGFRTTAEPTIPRDFMLVVPKSSTHSPNIPTKRMTKKRRQLVADSLRGLFSGSKPNGR